jgi:hypothetical protein
MKWPRDVSGDEAVKALQRLGFSMSRQTGSHVRLIQGIGVSRYRYIAIWWSVLFRAFFGKQASRWKTF